MTPVSTDDSDPRLLVIGAGSAGARHARLLHAAGARVSVTDPDPERAAASPLPFVPFDLDRLEGYDAIVVASPPKFHLDQTRAALETPASVLVEKPLATESVGLGPIVETGRGRLMIGYNLRLHEPLQRLVAMVHAGRAGRVTSVRLWFGSWLPDWRPTVDYRATYSASAELGGGVLLDAIHELDLLLWLLGDDRLEVMGAVVERLGPLEIDVEDTVKSLLRHESGAVVEISLDYLSRHYRRGVEVVGEEATIRLDWARQVIEVEDAGSVERQPADSPVGESYRIQAERFLAFVRGAAPPPVDGDAGMASVRLAERIRAAAS